MGEAPETVIEVRGLQTRIGGKWVHRGVDLEVRRGEIVAVVGSSGAGKSLLLQELIMLRRPSGGCIRLFGRDIERLSEREATALRCRFGVLFQGGALFGGVSVLENVAAPLHEHTALAEEAIRALARLKLALAGFPLDSARKYPRELSGGMVKRAALARALALDPRLLFLDEPSAGLDPVSADAIDNLIRRLRQALGLTVLMVTHDLDSLWEVADRAAFLAEGRVVAVGRPEEVARHPHPQVRAYFSGPRARHAQGRAWSRG